jgi:hypothetical protein
VAGDATAPGVAKLAVAEAAAAKGVLVVPAVFAARALRVEGLGWVPMKADRWRRARAAQCNNTGRVVAISRGVDRYL